MLGFLSLFCSGFVYVVSHGASRTLFVWVFRLFRPILDFNGMEGIRDICCICGTAFCVCYLEVKGGWE